MISIDIPNYSIEINVSEEEMNNRRKEMKLKKKDNIKGYLARYSRSVTSADTGAVIPN